MTAAGEFLPGVRAAIRDGRAPSPGVVARLASARVDTLGAEGSRRMADEVTTRLVGLGPLAPLAQDLEVTDILVNGDGRVWLDRGSGVEPAGVALAVDELRPLVIRLAGLAGRRLDDAQPWVDGVLPSGVRLHAVLPPVAEGGPQLSLRFARHRPGGVAALVALGTVTPPLAELLGGLVAARASLVVSGGTGAGKTTVLGALLAECDPAERIVVVEDVRELSPDHPHVVRLQGRGANVEGAGEVTLTALVRQALRMRPDRLVVGEVRGPEVRDLLAALNTGHQGGASTLHANSAREVPARLEALGSLAGMSREAVHSQLRGAVQAVVHVARRGRRRRVVEVGVVESADSGGPVEVVPAVDAHGPVLLRAPGWERLQALVAGPGVHG